mgnify:FL=1
MLFRSLLEENQRIKGTLRTGEQEYVTTVQDAANLEMNAAKRAYKEAYESGDSDALTDAQQALTRAELKLIRANNLKPSLQEDDYDVQQLQARLQPRQQAAPGPDEKAVAWQKRNSWFGQDDEMTSAALGLHKIGRAHV